MAARVRAKKVWCIWVDGRNTRGEVDQWIESITASHEGAKARAHRINTSPLLYVNQVAWVEYDEAAEETFAPNAKRRLTGAEVDEIKKLRATGLTLRVIADMFGVTLSTISLICRDKRRDDHEPKKRAA
jgi:DNA invertase Pin-like site-specific DNA recombinase